MKKKHLFFVLIDFSFKYLVTTSGAIQYGVPTIVDRLSCSGESWAQKPKSAGIENLRDSEILNRYLVNKT